MDGYQRRMMRLARGGDFEGTVESFKGTMPSMYDRLQPAEPAKPHIESPPARLGPLPPEAAATALQGPFTTHQAQEDAMGVWPRRLLHVPTLTSHEWTPGNVYGGWHQPLYNAITYTWGRWHIRPDYEAYETYKHTTALPVKNVSWKVPSVDPRIFTVEGFVRALRTATTVTTQQDSPAGIEFLWLDVACIDQENTEVKMLEIGRQAVIFQGAHDVYMWLHTIESQALLNTIEHLEANLRHVAPDRSLDEKTRYVNPPTDVSVGSMLHLLQDTWFSSLWTLQEAYLSNRACLMSKGADVVYDDRELGTSKEWLQPNYSLQQPGDYFCKPVQLNDILNWAQGFSTPNAGADVQGSYTNITLLPSLRKAGLRELFMENPMATYTAALHRSAFSAEDRVYAIQQVFRLRLGNSALHIDSTIQPRHSSKYELQELRDQLGEQLMLNHPVLSQMHVYTAFVPYGQAWRVNEASVAPGSQGALNYRGALNEYPRHIKAWESAEEPCVSFVKLRVKIVDNQIWGHFEGKMCTFHAFLAKSDTRGGTHGNLLQIWPDTAEQLQHPDWPGEGLRNIPSQRQREYAEWLATSIPKEKLFVLALGREFRYFDESNNLLGMLMYRCETFWRRVGIFRRKHLFNSDNTETVDWLEGKTPDWMHVKDIFG